MTIINENEATFCETLLGRMKNKADNSRETLDTLLKNMADSEDTTLEFKSQVNGDLPTV